MNITIAKSISDLMVEYGAKLDESITLIHKNCSEDEFIYYRNAIRKIMGYMLREIMNKIYQEHPSLKPDELL
jgi:hypothetical protein